MQYTQFYLQLDKEIIRFLKQNELIKAHYLSKMNKSRKFKNYLYKYKLYFSHKSMYKNKNTRHTSPI